MLYEVITLIDRIVDEVGFLCVDRFYGFDTALTFDPVEGELEEVDTEGRRGVVRNNFV